MAVVESAMLMGFRLGGDQAEDDSLAALLEAKIGEKNGGNTNSGEQGDDAAIGN
jgi:hypothetical protein